MKVEIRYLDSFYELPGGLETYLFPEEGERTHFSACFDHFVDADEGVAVGCLLIKERYRYWQQGWNEGVTEHPLLYFKGSRDDYYEWLYENVEYIRIEEQVFWENPVSKPAKDQFALCSIEAIEKD